MDLFPDSASPRSSVHLPFHPHFTQALTGPWGKRMWIWQHRCCPQAVYWSDALWIWVNSAYVATSVFYFFVPRHCPLCEYSVGSVRVTGGACSNACPRGTSGARQVSGGWKWKRGAVPTFAAEEGEPGQVCPGGWPSSGCDLTSTLTRSSNLLPSFPFGPSLPGGRP